MERVVHVNPLHLAQVHMCLVIVLVLKIFNAILPKVAEVIHVLLLDQSKAMAIRLID
jgi:hypothetical protein